VRRSSNPAAEASTLPTIVAVRSSFSPPEKARSGHPAEELVRLITNFDQVATRPRKVDKQLPVHLETVLRGEAELLRTGGEVA
jgi:hypothetical protein